MKRSDSILPAAVVLGLLVAGPGMACDYPRSPAVPNGETASEDEMFEAQRRVKAYVAAAEAYLSCLEAADSDPGEPITEKQAEINLKRYNAMVEEMHRVSDEYNIAVRIFKSRQ